MCWSFKDNRQYAKRDHRKLDEAGNYYSKHVSAMTAEGLHEKSDIAAELAVRDALLDEAEAKLEEANGLLRGATLTVEAIEKLVPNWKAYRDLPEAVEAALADRP